MQGEQGAKEASEVEEVNGKMANGERNEIDKYLEVDKGSKKIAEDQNVDEMSAVSKEVAKAQAKFQSEEVAAISEELKEKRSILSVKDTVEALSVILYTTKKIEANK